MLATNDFKIYVRYFEIGDNELSQIAADLDVIHITKNASQLPAAHDADIPETFPMEVQSVGDTGKKMYY
jgi:hypothetical protein